mgnify:CR=1 FL=1
MTGFCKRMAQGANNQTTHHTRFSKTYFSLRWMYVHVDHRWVDVEE